MQPAHHNHHSTHQQGTKWASKAWPKMTKNSISGPNLVVFWAKNLNFYWRKHKFWYPHNGKTTRIPCSHCFLVGHWTKWEKNANVWPKITKNANFLPNLTVFGSKFQILTKLSKSFGTHVTEKPHRHHVRIVFWFVMESNGPKMPIFGQKSQFRAKFGHLWAKNPIFLWKCVTVIFGQKCQFWTKFGHFWRKILFFEGMG